MKLGCKIVYIVIVFAYFLYVKQITAAVFNAITVMNRTAQQATVIFDCNVIPTYMIFSLHNPERIVVDFFKNYNIRKNTLPMNFNNDLVKCIRISAPVQSHSVRIVLDLADASIIEAVTQKKIDKNYRLVLTLFKKQSSAADIHAHKTSSVVYPKTHVIGTNRGENNKINTIKNLKFHSNSYYNENKKKPALIVVAIDAGHGGQDPGATGYNGMYEKDITINIAKKLKKLLDLDPMFNAVMVRDGDYFLPVIERSEIARKKFANVLISIHADSALNVNVRGASVWVLSNQRAQSEMTYLLKRSEKHSELLGGLGDILTSHHHDDPYFNYCILDLQFGYSQRVGHEIATHVLHQLKNVSLLHKNSPEYSNFGILRSPDIPSLLVETGFISNKEELHLLASHRYQKKIAHALYKGLREYFFATQLKNSLRHYSQNKNVHIVAAS